MPMRYPPAARILASIILNLTHARRGQADGGIAALWLICQYLRILSTSGEHLDIFFSDFIASVWGVAGK